MGNRTGWAGGKKVKEGWVYTRRGKSLHKEISGKGVQYIKNWWVYSTQGDTEVYVRRHYCGPKERWDNDESRR